MCSSSWISCFLGEFTFAENSSETGTLSQSCHWWLREWLLQVRVITDHSSPVFVQNTSNAGQNRIEVKDSNYSIRFFLSYPFFQSKFSSFKVIFTWEFSYTIMAGDGDRDGGVESDYSVSSISQR